MYLVLEMCQNGELNRYLKTTRKRLTENEGTPSCHEAVPSSFGLGTCIVYAIAWKPVRLILLCLQLGGFSGRLYKVCSTCTHTRSFTGTSVFPTCCSPEPWMPYVLTHYNCTIFKPQLNLKPPKFAKTQLFNPTFISPFM